MNQNTKPKVWETQLATLHVVPIEMAEVEGDTKWDTNKVGLFLIVQQPHSLDFSVIVPVERNLLLVATTPDTKC